MILPRFLHFYPGYTAQSALDEYVITFFSLVNAMFRLEARYAMDRIVENSVPHADKGYGTKVMDELKKQAKGLHGILQEVRTIKK